VRLDGAFGYLEVVREGGGGSGERLVDVPLARVQLLAFVIRCAGCERAVVRPLLAVVLDVDAELLVQVAGRPLGTLRRRAALLALEEWLVAVEGERARRPCRRVRRRAVRPSRTDGSIGAARCSGEF